MSGKKSEKEQNRLRLIKASIEEVKQRIAFLVKLTRSGHKKEALLLCCCYIEGFGNHLYWSDEQSAKNFVRILKECGGEEVLWHIHAKQLWIGLDEARSKQVHKIGEKLRPLLEKAEERLYTEEEIVTLAKAALPADDLNKLKLNLWRGTLAALAYKWIRSRLVHELSASPIEFRGITFRGNPVPPLDFPLLHRALLRVFQKMESLSLTSGKLYGHD